MDFAWPRDLTVEREGSPSSKTIEAASDAGDEGSPSTKKEVVPAWQKDKWGGFGLPAVAYSTDEGLGFGALGSVYRYDGATQPYRLKPGLQV